MTTKDETLTALAARLGFSTLKTQSTSADFREVPVWTVREVLEEAYKAGRNAGAAMASAGASQ